MAKRKMSPHIGSDFEDFLRKEGRLEETTGIAEKRIAKARARASLSETKALQLAVAETRAVRRQKRKR
jgi:hypothetical protein